MVGSEVSPARSCSPGEVSPERGMYADLHAVTEHLRNQIRDLQLISALIVVAAEALQAQNADIDADVAHVLKRDGRERLQVEIDRSEQLLAKLDRTARMRWKPEAA